MADLKTPGIYLDKISTGSSPIEGVSTSVVAFMGKAPRGDISTGFTMISSWSDFVQKASFGSTQSVFRNDDYMAYNIYNFYQNGGGKAYFGVIKPSSAKKATVILGDKGITLTAKSAGTWANDIYVSVRANANESGKFDIVVYREYTVGTTKKEDVLEQYTYLSNSSTDSNYFANALLASDIFDVSPEAGDSTYEMVLCKSQFRGGSDGTFGDKEEEDASLVGADGLIYKLDTINDVSLIINGGETSDTVLKGIIDYCTTRGDIYALLDAPDSATIKDITDARGKLKGLGEIHYPYVQMADPVTGIKIDVPASGMIAGAYARTDASQGVWKVAAGADAVLRGALGTKKVLTDAEYQTLFEAGVNCIMSKPNMGVLMYGARSLNQRYVSDDRLDIYVSKSIKEGTEWAVFELNDESLWLRLKTTILSFLEGLHLNGAFKGEGVGSAYYVTCDASINTDANIEKGIVTTEFGYATKKPAEFVVHRLNKTTASAN